MFRVMYLGGQSWLVQRGPHALLIDPLFGDRFATRGGARGFSVHPPRKINLSTLPKISGVVVTSERPMRFDLPSLDLLPRDVAIHLTNTASAAAISVLEEMGFGVGTLQPGAEIRVGDLRVRLLAPSSEDPRPQHRAELGALSIHESSGQGHFYLPVGGRHDTSMWRAGWSVVDRPCIWAFDVGFNRSWSLTWTTPNPAANLATMREFLERHEELSQHWQTPRAYVTCGPGFAYDGELAGLNRTAFPVDLPSLCRALDASLHDAIVHHLHPGTGFLVAEDGALEPVSDAELVTVPPPGTWPTTAFDAQAPPSTGFPPFSGDPDFDNDDFEQLSSLLRGLARSFAAMGVARDILALNQWEVGQRKRAFALVLRVGGQGQAVVLEYAARGCCFVQSDSQALMDDYPVGLELWASDLLLVLAGACTAEFLERGYCRSWNALPTVLRWSLADLIQVAAQPLLLPDEHLESYRAQVRRR